MRFSTRTSIVALSLAGALAGCAQTAPVPKNFTVVPAEKGGVEAPSCDRPVYPQQAMANKIEGTSTIGFLIDTDGKVVATRLYTSSGDASLDEAARSGLAKCKFKPAMANGKAVRAWIPIRYVWTLK